MPVSVREGGVAFVSITPYKEGMAYAPFGPIKEDLSQSGC